MIEQTLTFGESDHLVATLTLPAQGGFRQGGPMAVLTNSGVISRAGPHRMNVHLARGLAARGIPSVRFDMSGLGDSRRSNSSLPQMQQWVLDTRTVIDLAQRRTGRNLFFMVGFCSGAEVAYKAALDDERMRAVLLWDLYAYPTLQSSLRTFVFKLQRAGVTGSLRKLAGRLKMLLPGDPKGAGSDAGVRQLQDLEPQRVPPKDSFAGEIQRLTERGVEVLFMYCGGEPDWYNYRGQFRDAFADHGFVDKVLCERIEISDHLLTRPVAQQAFLLEFDRWLDSRVLPALGAGRAA